MYRNNRRTVYHNLILYTLEILMEKDTEIMYTKLSAIDGKTGGLLQITSILLVFVNLQSEI